MSYYCGIDLGGTNIKAGIVDGEGKLLNKVSIKTRAERAMEEIIHDMGQLAVDASYIIIGSEKAVLPTEDWRRRIFW